MISACLSNRLAKLAGWLVTGLICTAGAPAQTTTGWSLVWSDEFAQPDGSSPDLTKWVFETGGGGWGNRELEYYTSRTNNARIQGGNLVIEARQESYMGSNYTSARLKTQGKASWAYGRIEARIQIPYGQGIWPAFWMLGTNITPVGWPKCGEIDIMENIGREPTLVHGTVHGPGYSGGSSIGGSFSLPGTPAFADNFHVYSVEWTTNQIKWFVDGLQYFSVAPTRLPGGTNWVFNQPQFILLNVAVGGNWPGDPDTNTTFPQRMLVDYVRVYAPTNLVACGFNTLGNPGFEVPALSNWSTFGAGFNTVLGNIHNVPVHDGSNVFKVFGQFNGGINDSGNFQDISAVPGQSFTAGGWLLTPSNDQIAGGNTAWLEVSFRNASSTILGLYRSALFSSSTPADAWLYLPVTNQLDPATKIIIGSVTNLIAPPNTAFVRCQPTFRQPASAAGSVLFDDLKLSSGGATSFLVPFSSARVGSSLNFTFPTYLNLPYQLGFKANLSDPDWLAVTNIAGSGTAKSLTVDLSSPSRFYRITRLCE